MFVNTRTLEETPVYITFCLHLDHFTVNAYTKGVSPLEISRRLIGLAVARSESQISRRLAEN